MITLTNWKVLTSSCELQFKYFTIRINVIILYSIKYILVVSRLIIPLCSSLMGNQKKKKIRYFLDEITSIVNKYAIASYGSSIHLETMNSVSLHWIFYMQYNVNVSTSFRVSLEIHLNDMFLNIT